MMKNGHKMHGGEKKGELSSIDIIIRLIDI